MSDKKAILHFLLQATCKKFYKDFTKGRLQAYYVSIMNVILYDMEQSIPFDASILYSQIILYFIFRILCVA